MAENREHQLVEGDAVMRVSGGGHFKQKSIKSKFVSISLRDKLIFLFVGTLSVIRMCYVFLSVYKCQEKCFR